MSLAGPTGSVGRMCGTSATTVDGILESWNRTDDVWVFAYGSLIWHPGFPWVERRLVTVRGFHRALCLWSHDHRGSPDNPGLVFGLDRGGCCRGVAFRIAAADVPHAFETLWQREMPTGAYTPRWVGAASCRSEAPPVRALAFLLNRACSHYAGELPEDTLLTTIRNAVGASGPCLDYVTQTARALRDHGIDDERLGSLVRRLTEASATAPVTAAAPVTPLASALA